MAQAVWTTNHRKRFRDCAVDVLYLIPLECGEKFYIGETGQCVNQRLSQHANNVRKSKNNACETQPAQNEISLGTLANHTVECNTVVRRCHRRLCEPNSCGSKYCEPMFQRTKIFAQGFLDSNERKRLEKMAIEIYGGRCVNNSKRVINNYMKRKDDMATSEYSTDNSSESSSESSSE